MFFTIIKTILKASITIFFFIFAFALAFYMLLTDMVSRMLHFLRVNTFKIIQFYLSAIQPMFSELHFAVFRVATMMGGDVSFEEVFNYMQENNRMQTAGTVFAVMSLVVIFINIAFANLLVRFP